jgi:predicted transposase/invertase (TIGR01784 family)
MGIYKPQRWPMTTDLPDIDFSILMDLRVDYAFKLLCISGGGTRRLMSILNAIFENKHIPRVVTGLTIVNPFLEKIAVEDKLSVLDVRATLDDGTTVCIEMHLYELLGLKYKVMRSWARAYGEALEPGQGYAEQNMVICIAFVNGPITDATGKPIEKTHALFCQMERDSHEVLLYEQEMHFINMKEFLKEMSKAGKPTAAEASGGMFTKWMLLINHKDIEDKEMLRDICAEGELRDAMETLTRLSQDSVRRQAYQRRLDELRSYNNVIRQIAEYRTQLEEKDAAIADKDALIADKNVAIADKDALIAELTAQLNKDGNNA